MRDNELRAVDLNLLVPLRALLAERHITRAARHVGMSQPAMSRALSRLREMFGDPLLVSAQAGLQLTPRAQQVQSQLEALLGGVGQLLQGTDFDPAYATGTVRIAAPDFMVYKLLPTVLQEMREQAPGLHLEVERWRPDWLEQLHQGRVDLTIGQATGEEAGIYQQVLVTTDWMCVVRRGHPCLQSAWTAQSFASLDHLLVGVQEDGSRTGQVDEALERLGLTRRVVLRMPYAVVSPLLVAESDLVLTTSRWLASRFTEQVGLVMLEPPVELPPVQLPMLWHERTHRQQRARWVRGLLAQAAGRLDPATLRAQGPPS